MKHTEISTRKINTDYDLKIIGYQAKICIGFTYDGTLFSPAEIHVKRSILGENPR